MTTSEELAILRGWDSWLGFLDMLDIMKSPAVTWRIALSCHCDAVCQPGLDHSGLETPTRGATGGWRVSSLQLPHMFKSGDNLNTEYESPQDVATKAEVQQVACREIAAFFLLSDPRNVKLSETVFSSEVGVKAVRQHAEELQGLYAIHLSKTPMTTADGEPLLPTYQCVRQPNAPRQPQRSGKQTVFKRLLTDGETQEDRDARVIELIKHHLAESKWHDTRKLPWEVWIALTKLVRPHHLLPFFNRHLDMFTIRVHMFCWGRLPREGERVARAHGSSFRTLPLGTWFAKRGSPNTSYGTIFAMHDDIPEIEWEDKRRSVEYWTDLCGLLPLRFEQDFKVGQELCAWWDGWCHQVTCVSRKNWYDLILVKWGEIDIYVSSELTWALETT